MALVPCSICRQPFYASCHDASCINALCPLCEYADDSEAEQASPSQPTLLPIERIQSHPGSERHQAR